MSEEIAIIKKEFYAPLKQDWVTQSGLSEADFNREVSFAIQHIHKQPLLSKCTQQSLLKAVINLAQVGLTLNPISKYAYIIPRYNRDKKSFEAVLEPDYRGLQKLLTDSGAVKSIDSRVVWSGDDIEIDMANEKRVTKHTPYWLMDKDKGKIRGVYSIATLSDNSLHFEQMSYTDICEIRERSESYKAYMAGKIPSAACIWVTDESEMCRKTVIKRHYKYLPKSAGMEKLEKAIELDNEANGFDEPIGYGTSAYIEGLISEAQITGEEKQSFIKRLQACKTQRQGLALIEELQPYQPVYGRDKFPISTEQINEAVRYAADKDDLHDQRTNKNNY